MGNAPSSEARQGQGPSGTTRSRRAAGHPHSSGTPPAQKNSPHASTSPPSNVASSAPNSLQTPQNHRHKDRRKSPHTSPRSKLRTDHPMGGLGSRPRDDSEVEEGSAKDRRSNASSKAQGPEHTPAMPVQVPGSSKEERAANAGSQIQPSSPLRDDVPVPPTNFQFPPRLPIPIQEEVYKPGSPLISPADVPSDLHEEELDGQIPRRTSLLSHTTLDDEDVDYEALGLEGAKGKTVPTTVEWKQGGERVYVTGTFAGWSRKYRMHRNPATNVLSTVLDLVPGTHHVKFIVDGEMQLSNELPTAVDYTNILVNYIEASADDIPEDVEPEKVPEGLFPPQVLPTRVPSVDRASMVIAKAQEVESQRSREPAHFGRQAPKYLADMDQEENAKHFQRAASHIAEIPPPASLPPFLNKSILNGTTPMKDDNSVLNMPNHTVLNHLATSSIKNAVLATTITTRYKRKYVTTIMNRPISTDGD